jgi:hypothetical protein
LDPTDTLAAFVRSIGIPVVERDLPDPTFLPGIAIEAGSILVDRPRLLYPGDLLHEAGHVAVMLPTERPSLSDRLAVGPGDEMAAIAWSWAAALHIGIDPAILFHPSGYKGESATLLENFQAARYFGVPLLQYYGMTRQRDNGSGAAVFPRMRLWLRPSP